MLNDGQFIIKCLKTFDIVLLISVIVFSISFLTSSFPTASASPTVTITSPTNGLVVSAGVITVTGTASDPTGIQNVMVSVDSGMSFLPATATTPSWSSWSFTTSALTSGSHTIIAKATSITNSGTQSVPVGTHPNSIAVNA